MTSARTRKARHDRAASKFPYPLGMMRRFAAFGAGSPPLYYVLNGKRFRPAYGAEAAAFFSSKKRLLWRTNLMGKSKFVSTVFLCTDHSWGKGGPVLFETLVFGVPHYEPMTRYRTWEQAKAGHRKAVKAAIAHLSAFVAFRETVFTPQKEQEA